MNIRDIFGFREHRCTTERLRHVAFGHAATACGAMVTLAAFYTLWILIMHCTMEDDPHHLFVKQMKSGNVVIKRLNAYRDSCGVFPEGLESIGFRKLHGDNFFGVQNPFSVYYHIFEYIRLREYPDRISRLNCNYYFDDLDTLKVLFQYDWGSEPEEAAKVHIYAMELPEEEPQYCDMRLFDEAYDAMEKGQDLNTALQCARRYFASGRTSEPVLELLSEKSAAITGEMTRLHEELMAQCRAQAENQESAQAGASNPNPAGQ